MNNNDKLAVAERHIKEIHELLDTWRRSKAVRLEGMMLHIIGALEAIIETLREKDSE